MAEPRRDRQPFDDAIRAALFEAGLVSESSPGASARGEHAIALLRGVARAAWDSGHRARAAELLALRGEVRATRDARDLEHARRTAAEREVRELRRKLRTAESHGRFFEFWAAINGRNGRARHDELDDATRREGRRTRQMTELQAKVRRQRLAIRVLCSLIVAMSGVGGALASVIFAHLHDGNAWIAVVGTAALDLCALGFVWFGRRRLIRVVGALFVVLQITADILQVLDYRRR